MAFKTKNNISILLALLTIPNLAFAQQQISVRDIQIGFSQGVALCAKSMALQIPISQLPQSDRDLIETGNAQQRRFASVAENQPVYSVKYGHGSVVLTEQEAGKCRVTTYGPRVATTLQAVGETLQSPEIGYHIVNSENNNDTVHIYEKSISATRVAKISLSGSEPGAGRTFTYPLLVAIGEVANK